jgi:hypothetical protein
MGSLGFGSKDLLHHFAEWQFSEGARISISSITKKHRCALWNIKKNEKKKIMRTKRAETASQLFLKK